MKSYITIAFACLIGMSSMAQEQEKDSITTNKLEEVIVKGAYKRYKTETSVSVARMPLKNLENPQVYSSISSNLLQDQLVTQLDQALRNATGVSRLWESTGRGGDGAAFFSLRGFSVQPTLTNSVASFSNMGLDPANIETIEVLKGPSGTLFGGNIVSYGGLINVITKKPFKREAGALSYIHLGNGGSRLTLDYNTPLNKDLAIRVNAAYQNQQSFQNAGFRKSFFVAPSLSYRASDKLSFDLNAEIQEVEGAYAPMIFLNRFAPLSFDNIEVFENQYLEAFTSNDLVMRNPSYSFQGKMKWILNDKWQSETIFSSSNAKTDGYYQYLWDSTNGNEFTRFISKRNGHTLSSGIQQNFLGQFKLAGMENKLLIGVDYLDRKINNQSSGYVGHGVVALADQTDSGVLTSQAVDNSLLESFEGISTAATKSFGAYVSNVLNFSEKFSAMASVRLDYFEGIPSYWAQESISGQTTLSPKFGLVYQPIENGISFFGNYMNGFTQLDPTQVADVDGSNPRIKVYEPEQANQYEFGTKLNIINDNATITASYYHIDVTNKLMADPNNVNNNIQGAAVVSKGFEASIVTNPIRGLNIVAGYAHNISEVTKDTPAGGYLGLRPEEAGPETLINFWANYTFLEGGLKNMSLGFGGNYASEHHTLNRANIGQFTLPSYTVLNSVIAYQWNQASIQLKVDNITNKRYFTGWSTVSPQQTRIVSLGLNYQF